MTLDAKISKPVIGGVVKQYENYSDSELEEKIHSESPKIEYKNPVMKFLDIYFRPKSWERKRLYEKIGVRGYKKFVMNTVGRLRRKTDKDEVSNYFIGSDRSVKSLKTFDKYTRFNESIHLSFLILNLSCYVNSLPASSLLSLFMAGYIIYELYTIMLQRYNRVRVYNTLDLVNEKFYEKRESS